tara:strand:+ start:71 stop:853 length:783 start_codon:yes stop_codon:yes gene_type:complete
MRNIADKTDNVSTLSAAEFNGSIMQELENAVTSAGITLDPSGGADTSDEMLGEAITRTAQGAMSYTDGGAADAYVLTAQGGFVQSTAYTDGMTVIFKAGNTNTGASTVNVSGVGVANIVDATGAALTAGAIVSGEYYAMTYDLGNTRFEVSSSQPSGGISSSSYVQNGYVVFSDGLIVQWGKDTPSTYGEGAENTVNFPVTFPNSCWSANISYQASSFIGSNGTHGIQLYNTPNATRLSYSFDTTSGSATGDIYFIAVGY